jgi:hypothetical protein
MCRQSGETASFFIIIIEKLVACSFDKTRLPLTCVIFRISSYNFKASNQFSSIYVPICKIYFVDIFDYFFLVRIHFYNIVIGAVMVLIVW